MALKFRILMVEDVSTDAELIRLELKKANIDYESKIVMTETEFLQEIELYKPDIILSDYALPQFNGLKALQLTRNLYSHLPFILVTGSTNEEIAVECMKQGADDYVLKRSLKRLPAALENAIERRKAQLEKEEAENRYRSLFENSLDGIYRITAEGKFIDANSALVRMFGYQSKEDLFALNESEDLGFLRMRHKGEKVQNKIFLLTNSGKEIWIEDSSRAVFNEEGQVIYYEGIVRDITERKKAEEMIKFQSYHDNLTKLPNRMLFHDHLNLALAHAQRNQQMLAVIFLDLDRFKVVNDILGHAKGDGLLQGVAKRITRCVDEGDTVARMGGDEFALLITGIYQAEDVAKITQKIIEVLKFSFNLDGREVYITTSIGISLYPGDGQEGEALLKNSEAAMYRAKEKGGNNYQFYTPAMNARITERLALENSLRHALEREEILVYYQPQIDMRTGKIIGMEALVRWQHHEMGLISPAKFIPLAEETGLIIPLGELVLRTACTQNKIWQDEGLPSLRVAVNLSARQFQEENLVQLVAATLQETGLDPQWLELEITESVVMQDVDFTIDTLQQLRKMGVQIAIDDFGTGYSSLSYLKKFPINTLKIDQSFIRDLILDPNDATITTAMIILAHNLNLMVTAEGVETAEQLDFLRQQRCDKMQGYLFSPPLPAKLFTKLLTNNHSILP